MYNFKAQRLSFDPSGINSIGQICRISNNIQYAAILYMSLGLQPILGFGFDIVFRFKATGL